MSNKILKKVMTALSIIAVTSMVMVSPALAGDTETTRDSSGNLFVAGTKIAVAEQVGNELFMAGQDVNANGTDVDGSVFMAGMNVSFNGSSAGSSVFIAGMNINIDADANNNIWTCGQNLSLGENTSAKALHVAGETVTVKGNYDFISAVGNTIIFDGTVTGDAEFEGNVTFGSNAKIDGNITVKAPMEPVIEDGAEISNVEFQLVSKNDSDIDDDDDSPKKAAEIATKAAKKTIGFVIFAKIRKFIYWAFAFAVFAIVFATLFGKNLTDSYEMSVKTRALAFWLSGVIGLVAIPMAVLILCITVIGAPAGLFILGVYLLLFLVARVFAFSSLIRELIFSHTNKRLNPILETVLAVLIGALTKVIPVISGIVGLISKAYILGYAIQTVYLKMNGAKKNESVESETIEG